ncbi:MAG: Tetratricopeptide repeat-containing protein [Gemmatimonadetes bacterium]|nr:Tetratricopeptide repeat-containing protein [Gemmatimonadota bacterium]
MTRTHPPRLLAISALLASALAGAGVHAQAPATPRTPVEQAAALMRQGRYADARRMLAPYARAHPRDAGAALWLGRAYVAMDSTDQAVEWLQRSVSLRGTAEAHLALARAYGAQASEANLFAQPFVSRKARAAMEAAVAAEPRNPTPRFALLQFDLGTPWLYGGSRGDAEEQARGLARISPYWGALGAAVVAANSGDMSGAERTLAAAARQYPDSAIPVSMLAGVHRQKRQWDRAWAALDDFTRRHPQDRHLLLDVGATARASGKRLEDGERAFLAYVSAPVPDGSPPAAAARFELGQLYEQKGRKDLARAQYTQVLAMDPGFLPARTALRALDLHPK